MGNAQDKFEDPGPVQKNRTLDGWLQNLQANIIRIDEEERKRNNEALEELWSGLLIEMKKNPLFRAIFRRKAPAGSSWEGLRICTPNEFDMNIILMPQNICSDVEIKDMEPGHVGIYLPSGFPPPKMTAFTSAEQASVNDQLSNWVDKNWIFSTGDNNFVKRDRVIKWMQGVVDESLFRLKSKRWSLLKSVSRSQSGPAITLNVVSRNGQTFSVDLVPAFEFSTELLPTRVQSKVRRVQSSPYICRSWYAVPKGPTTNSATKLWRTSLYEIERDLMWRHEHLKPCIRMLKRLRDVQMWKPLSSYYLKTVCMWSMEERSHWRTSLSQTFISMLEDLRNATKSCSIPYYWDPSLNLLDNTNTAFYLNVAGALERIIKDFQRSLDDPNVDPMVYFGCTKEGRTIQPVIANDSSGQCAIM